MRNTKNSRLIYVVISVVVLILNALPIIIRDDAAITQYSSISVIFALCSAVYAMIAFIFKDK